MTRVTQLPFITSSTTATSFLVVDDRNTRRILYDDVVDRIIANLQETDLRGPTGPAGPAGTTPGPTGPTGPAGPSGPGLPAGGTTGQVLVKSSDTDYATTWATNSGGGGSSVGLSSRSNAVGLTSSIAAGSTTTVDIVGHKTYVLSKVATDYPAWVRIYTDATSRTADLTRYEGTDPLPGAGVVAEVITSAGFLTQSITPGVIGFNNDNVTTSTVYVSVTNKDSSTRAVTVTLTLLQLES